MRAPLLSVVFATTMLGCTSGSGVPGQEARTPGQFEAIDVGGPFHVTVTVGPETSVSVTGDDNVVPKVRTELDGSTLHVELPGRVVTSLPLEVTIATPTLVDLDAGGASTVDVSGLTGEHFEVDVSGASRVTLQGAVTELEVDVSGASRLHAQGLPATKVEVDASGASTAEVHASEEVEVEASGASTVRVAGNPPQVSKDTSGASKIEI